MSTRQVLGNNFGCVW